MSFLGFLTSTQRPKAGTPALSPQQVRERILALNRASAPFQIIDGKSDGADLIAEWKIRDKNWFEVFANSGVSKVFRTYLTLIHEKKEVQALDREYAVKWHNGTPMLSIATKTFRGQMQSVEFGAAYRFVEEMPSGGVHNYRFNTKEIKQPIQDAVTAAGWIYKGRVF